jgi:hypothetical protein
MNKHRFHALAQGKFTSLAIIIAPAKPQQGLIAYIPIVYVDPDTPFDQDPIVSEED